MMPPDATAAVTLSPVADWAALGERWRELESRADVSFFQTWTWIGCLAPERYDDPVLLEAGVQPWMELPMWAPGTPEFAAVWDVTGDRALRTGIRYRPLSDTVRDTWSWLRRDAAARGGAARDTSARDVAARGGASASEGRPRIGLDPAKEQEILASLD